MSILCPKCDSENPRSARFCNNCSGPLLPIEETKVYSKDDVQEPERKLSVGSVVGNKFKIVEDLGG
jgi:predicted amidophosphoribosyltransferase